MAVEVVGYAGWEAGNLTPETPEQFDLPLPADIMEGDLVVVAELTYPGTMPALPYPKVYAQEAANAWNRAVWVGPWTGERLPSGAPAPLHMMGSGYRNAAGQFYRAQVVVLRNAVVDYGNQASSSYPMTPGLPFPGGGQAVSVAFGRGGLGGFSGDPWRGTSWSRVLGMNQYYVCTEMALHPGPTVPTETAQFNGDGSVWEFFAIAVSTTEPTTGMAPLRCFPRDDALGPQTGRLIPPPTSWQTGRRYGGGAIR